MSKLYFFIFFILLVLNSCKIKKETTGKQQNIFQEKEITIDSIFPEITYQITDFKNAYNVKNYGAKGNGKDDDTRAIQRCFNEIKKNGGGTAYFPKGTYIVSHANYPGKSWCLVGVDNLTIIGESRKNSILQLAEHQKNYTRILILEKNNDIIIDNMTFDGNVAGQNNPDNPNEHLADIFIDQSKNVNIKNSNFINTGGDGITIRGVKTPSTNIKITNCIFDNNHRDGITLGSGFNQILIKNNLFKNTIKSSPIDTEPTAGICKNVIIENNIFNTRSLLTIGGVSYKNPGYNFLLKDNILNDTSIFIVHGDSIVIKNNSINITKPVKEAITCLMSNESIYINNNNISINNKTAIYLATTHYTKVLPNRIHITNNIIQTKNNAYAFYIRGANNVLIRKNEIKGDNSKIGIYCYATVKMKNIRIEENRISGVNYGILVEPLKQNPLINLKIQKNIFDSVSKKIYIKTSPNQNKQKLLKNLIIQ